MLGSCGVQIEPCGRVSPVKSPTCTHLCKISSPLFTISLRSTVITSPIYTANGNTYRDSHQSSHNHERTTKSVTLNHCKYECILYHRRLYLTSSASSRPCCWQPVLPGEETGGFGAGAIGTLPVLIPATEPFVFVPLLAADPPAAAPPFPFLLATCPAGAMLAIPPPPPPTEPLPRASALCAPLARFLFLITSVFNDNGRTTPCSLRKSPHALHRG